MSASMAMLKEIFSKALECTSVAERERYVTEACGGDTALRAEVDALLRAHASAGNFLGLPAIDHFLAAAGRPCPSADTAAVPAAPADETTLAFLAPSPTPGALGRLDHYDIAAVIGRGGMGIVLKAFDQKLHRVVAVKVMVPELAASPQARKRFVREAQAAAAVRHEHVIDIHAVEDAGPLPYLVMECIEGVSLEERLRRTGKLRLKEVLRIGLQIAQGLAAAHAQGLVHRDIKPANILLENGVERVKITDFGLARPVADTGMTQPGIIAGTPQFMAPEQARAGLVDRRADLFSLGSVLYMMCTGRPPFAGGDSIAVLKCVCDEQPRPVRELNLAVPGWLAALIERLHTKDPAGRCQSAAEVAERLAQGLAHVQEPALVPPPKVDTPRSVARPGPRRRAAIAIGALTLGLGAWWLAPALYRFAAGKAVLEVQTNDTQAKVIVRQGDRQVARLDLTHDAFVDLDAGDYELDLIEGRGDLCLSPTRVALARGGHQVVVVHEAPDHVGEVRRFEGHLSAVRSVAFSPTGPWLLSGSHDKTLRLWDMQSGREIRRYVGHTGKVTGIAFSPDGSRILSASDDKTIRLWDTQTAKPIRELLGHTGFVLAAAFMPDGRHALTASYDQTLRLWDLVTAETVRIFRGHTDAVWSVAITADGTRAVSGSWDETARIWNVQTGDEVGRFTRHAGRVWPVAISPDGRLAATGGSDSKIWLWELSSGKELHCLPGHDGFVVCSLGFHPNGRALLSGGFDSSVRLWDVATGAQRYRFDGHHGHVRTVTVSADGRHAISGAGEDWLPKADNAVLLWRLPQ